MLTKTSICSV